MFAKNGHYVPHDFDTRRPGQTREKSVTTLREIMWDAGYSCELVERTSDKLSTIQVARQKLAECDFDEAECGAGIPHMENYSRDWDEKLATWKPFPRHDIHSHCADGWFTFSDGFYKYVENNETTPQRKKAPY